MRGAWRLHRARHWLRCRLTPPALVLMYHRVIDLPSDPHLLAVSPSRFGEHLAAIREHCTPVPLHDLVESIRRNKLPPRAVAITFDDGYADNLEIASPLLHDHGIPATVFVAAGQVGADREFWWDDLERLLLQPGTLPSSLSLSVNGRRREWQLEEASVYTQEQFLRHRQWHIECPDDPGPRQRLFRAVFEQLYSQAPTDRHRLMDELTAWAGKPPSARPEYRTLTEQEVARLGEDGLIEVGAHTMTHPVLATLPPGDQQQEIRESKHRMQDLVGREVTSFAYPHGIATPDAVAALGDAGFICACGSQAEAVFRGADPFQLPRLGVRNWDGDSFARWLRWWLGR